MPSWQVVIREVFMAAMFDANQTKFLTFLLWYSQAGNPCVDCENLLEHWSSTLHYEGLAEGTSNPRATRERAYACPICSIFLSMKIMTCACSVQRKGVSLRNVTNLDGSSVTTAVLQVDKAEHEFRLCTSKRSWNLQPCGNGMTLCTYSGPAICMGWSARVKAFPK
jgi:aminopeptidase N